MVQLLKIVPPVPVVNKGISYRWVDGNHTTFHSNTLGWRQTPRFFSMTEQMSSADTRRIMTSALATLQNLWTVGKMTMYWYIYTCMWVRIVFYLTMLTIYRYAWSFIYQPLKHLIIMMCCMMMCWSRLLYINSNNLFRSVYIHTQLS